MRIFFSKYRDQIGDLLVFLSAFTAVRAKIDKRHVKIVDAFVFALRFGQGNFKKEIGSSFQPCVNAMEQHNLAQFVPLIVTA